jgi:heme/copper-type cytochrome/quinol oxidase subunit 4
MKPYAIAFTLSIIIYQLTLTIKDNRMVSYPTLMAAVIALAVLSTL